MTVLSLGAQPYLALLILSSPASDEALAVQDFLPCRPGTSIEYQWHDEADSPQPVFRADEVLTEKGRLCFIRMRTWRGRREADQPSSDDVYVLERLPDRILDAGWKDSMTAFRAPLLRSPIESGRRWRFNRVDYRVELVEDGLPPSVRAAVRVGLPSTGGAADGAGRRVPGRGPVRPDPVAAIRVEATSIPAGHYHAVRTYVRGIGLVKDERLKGAWIAVKVSTSGSIGRFPRSR